MARESTGQLSRSKKVQQASAQLTTQEMTERLVELIGSTLVAEACGVHRSTISKWADGHKLSIKNEKRLRTLDLVTQTILQNNSEYTLTAWLIGMNTDLDDLTPVEALAEDRNREVYSAALSF